jgi:hypothetical protein
MLAIDVLLLDHKPPEVASNNVVDPPAHILVTPVIAAGKGFTITVLEILQPLELVKLINGDPAATPVTIPVGPTTAREELLLVHVPAPPPSANGVVEPAHTDAVPVIAGGNGLTVASTVEIQPVGSI